MSENQSPIQSYKFGEFVLLPDQRILMRSGQRVHLTPRLFHLLQILVENPGRLVSKETLLREIWKDSFVEEGNLNSTVSRLRKILGETPDQKLFIETIPRVGYRFLADVETFSDNIPLTSAVAPQPRRSAMSRWLILSIAGLALVSIVFVAYRELGFSANESLDRHKNIPFRLTDDQRSHSR